MPSSESFDSYALGFMAILIFEVTELNSFHTLLIRKVMIFGRKVIVLHLSVLEMHLEHTKFIWLNVLWIERRLARQLVYM